MPPLTVIAVLELLMKYGPTAVAMAQKLIADIEAGKGDKAVSAADLDELNKLAAQTSADIYEKLGIQKP